MHKQVNIECDFIVGTGGMGSLEFKEMTYKKQQNDDIIKKLFLFLLKVFFFKLIISIYF